jgi:hypothetical protein
VGRRIKVSSNLTKGTKVDLNEFASQFSEDDYQEMAINITALMATTSSEEKMDWLQNALITAMARSEDVELERATPPLVITKQHTLECAHTTVRAFLDEAAWDKDFIHELVYVIMMTMYTLDGKIVDGQNAD